MRPTKQQKKKREIIIIISVLLFCSCRAKRTGRLAAHTPLIRIQWAFERRGIRSLHFKTKDLGSELAPAVGNPKMGN